MTDAAIQTPSFASTLSPSGSLADETLDVVRRMAEDRGLLENNRILVSGVCVMLEKLVRNGASPQEQREFVENDLARAWRRAYAAEVTGVYATSASEDLRSPQFVQSMVSRITAMHDPAIETEAWHAWLDASNEGEATKWPSPEFWAQQRTVKNSFVADGPSAPAALRRGMVTDKPGP